MTRAYPAVSRFIPPHPASQYNLITHILEAKTNLSELVRRALKGEEVQITAGRERIPVVRLVPIHPKQAGCRLGFLEGQGKVGPEFFEPLPDDELRLWK